MQIMPLLERILRCGVTPTTSSQDARRIIFSNKVSIMSGVLGVLFALTFLLFDLYLLTLSAIPFVLLFLSPILINKQYLYTHARYTLIFAVNLSVAHFASALGEDSGMLMIYIVFFAMLIFMFDLKTEKKHMILLSLFTIGMMAYTKLSHFNAFGIQTIPLSEGAYTILFFSSFIVSIAANIISLSMYYTAHTNAEEALILANTQITTLYKDSQHKRFMLEKVSQQTAFSTLSQGIAHLIRNPMGIILTSVELLTENTSSPKKIEKFCEITKTNLIRLSRLTTNMIKYGSAGFIHDISLNTINDAIASAINTATPRCESKKISIEFIQKEFPPILFDPNALPQAILDILINAIEASKENETILIETELTTFQPLKGAEKKGLKISITDTGSGIPEDKKSFIFDPYFTTKYGHSGLGLNIALKIIAAHDGTLTFRTPSTTIGTTVEICIPLTPSKKIQTYQQDRKSHSIEVGKRYQPPRPDP
jgi:signal transduction histidine kinase